MNDSSIYPEWNNDLKAPATYTRQNMNGKDELKSVSDQPVSDSVAEPLATTSDLQEETTATTQEEGSEDDDSDDEA